MNNYYDIDDLQLNQEQKKAVLEWFARKLWILLEEGSGEPDYYHKSYDPLVIEGHTAHSYVFDLSEHGGRHHNFDTLKELEERLVNYGIETIKQYREEERL